MQQETVEVTTGAPQTDEGMVQCVDEVKDRQPDRNDMENVEESQDTRQTAVTSRAENQNTAAGCSNVENGTISCSRMARRKTQINRHIPYKISTNY